MALAEWGGVVSFGVGEEELNKWGGNGEGVLRRGEGEGESREGGVGKVW